MRHKLVWVSLPFQFNWYQHVGPLELSTFILNVQPVIPLKLNDDWNVILRIIVRSSASRLCLTAMPRARAAAVPDRTRSLINSRSNPQCSRRLRRRADHSAECGDGNHRASDRSHLSEVRYR